MNNLEGDEKLDSFLEELSVSFPDHYMPYSRQQNQRIFGLKCSAISTIAQDN